MNFTFRPIDVWPGERAGGRKRSQFKASLSDTRSTLYKELRALNAKSVVIMLALDEADIRLDGEPRASARPSHPGVVLSFDSTYGPLKYMSDTFDHWHDNLRAIALGLEALRKVDRYGITKRGEQYTGWNALTQSAASMTREQAAEFIRLNGGSYREAARKLHPDAGGSHDEFTKLQQARELLGAPST